MPAKTAPDLGLLGVRGIIGSFFREMEEELSASWAPRVGRLMSSNQAIETYRLAGMVSPLREWKGGRHIEPLRVDDFQIKNVDFEGTLAFSRADWRRDKTGQLAIRASGLAQRAASHWEKLTTEVLLANGNSYDGTTFFSATHSLGASGTQINELTATEVPALNVAGADPTVDEMGRIITGMIQHAYSYKDDKGEPINGSAKAWEFMVPTNHIGTATAALRSALRESGSTNQLGVQDFNINLIRNPRLTAGDEVYMFRGDSAMKAVILQEEVPVEMDVVGPGSEEYIKNGRLLFAAYASRNVGYGEPLHALRGTIS